MITQYLFDHYYSHCPKRELIPTREQIEQALSNHPEKVIVIQDKEIKGVGVFLTLTDKTFSFLHNIDITRIEVLQALALENGENIHFVLLAADGLHTIMTGLTQVIRTHKPKTVSWWNPEFTKLHTYRLR